MNASLAPQLQLKKRMHLKYLYIRKKLLGSILRAANIEYISEHWIYTNELNAESIAIDLGANKGNFSKEVTKLFHNKCYAIEPNAELYNRVNCKNIIKLNVAITSTNGPVTFYVSKNPEASSLLKDFDKIWENDKKVVEGVTFKTLLDKLHLTDKKIDILKVDIEGAELELFDSLTVKEAKNIRQISVEFHDWINKDLHDRTVKAIEKLISFGFAGYSYTPSRKWTVDMLFINKELIQLNFKQRVYLTVFKMITFIERNTIHRIFLFFSSRSN